MSLYPEVQRKVQEELDRVVGPDRLPEFWDYDNLVYLRATMLETMRWMVVAPLGVPHRVIQDDEYKGYLIPKGTIVNIVRNSKIFMTSISLFHYCRFSFRIFGKKSVICPANLVSP